MLLNQIENYVKSLQDSICEELERLDGKSKFNAYLWIRDEGGGGDTRTIINGDIFEKGGVNFSHVYGEIPDFLKSETVDEGTFHATGLSLVIHPQNPFVPIVHMNVRYFCMLNNEKIVDQWFGGGIDLSPAYPNSNDTTYFHKKLKDICDKHDSKYYDEFKKWCDNYFTIQHRKEMRGIGGIFYDHLRPKSEIESYEIFDFMKSIGDSFSSIYSQIVKNNKDKTYNDSQKQWQFIRRGRYAEFNLVYDRGTHFGLKTNGRIESILMSLPPRAEWYYDYHPIEGSQEHNTLSFFQPQDWCNNN